MKWKFAAVNKEIDWLEEEFIDDELEAVLDDRIDAVGEDAFVGLLSNYVGLVRVVDVDGVGDTPGDQRGRVVEELGAQDVVVHLECALRCEVLELGHFARHAD